MSDTTQISVIIPAFNEQPRILRTIHRINAHLARRAITGEIVVVDDASTDLTRQTVALESKMSTNIRLISLPSNLGKGYAVRQGILNAAYGTILVTDADLSTPIEEIDRFIPLMAQGYDILIGSRALKESHITKPQPWHRTAMGRIFNLIVRKTVLGDFSDTQCGFKMFRSEPARKLFRQLKTAGYAFDVEVLLRAKQMGYRMKEVPVIWENSPHSKVRVLRDSIRMLADIIRIRARMS